MSKSNNPVTQRSGASTNIILTVIVLVVAVAVIGGVLWFGGNNNSQAADPADPKTAELIAPPDSNKVSDSPDDKVTLTEFLDFQCPACQQNYQQLTKDLEQKYQGSLYKGEKKAKGRVKARQDLWKKAGSSPLALHQSLS